MTEYLLATISLLSAIGVIALKKPVHACLSFLVTLVALASLYLQLSAPFIAVMQVLVYAGAILVIFMFVIVLFQDAYLAIREYAAQSPPLWQIASALLFLGTAAALGLHFQGIATAPAALPVGYGSVEELAKALYIDFFFPFEAVAFLFLVAII